MHRDYTEIGVIPERLSRLDRVNPLVTQRSVAHLSRGLVHPDARLYDIPVKP